VAPAQARGMPSGQNIARNLNAGEIEQLMALLAKTKASARKALTERQTS